VRAWRVSIIFNFFFDASSGTQTRTAVSSLRHPPTRFLLLVTKPAFSGHDEVPPQSSVYDAPFQVERRFASLAMEERL
jgi:hypothetical protein